MTTNSPTSRHPSAPIDRHPLHEECKPQLGDLVVSYLADMGVDYVFGVPGGAIEPLYNALARSERRGGPRPVVARHETGAAFMADGYARQTGRPGVCCATTGPGATNMITGVCSAYENRIPLLVITAQTALADFGRGAFQESSCTGVNTLGMLQHCTRYNSLVSHVDQFERKLVAAIMAACLSEPGPAHLSIPLDLLRQPAPVSRPSYDIAALLQRPALIDSDGVAALFERLENARKVVFVVGEGCQEAIGALAELAFVLDATIVSTPHGKGLISAYHPLFRGIVGFAGHNSARETLLDPDVDTVVVVGSSLGEWATSGWGVDTLRGGRLVHVDAAESNLARSPMAGLHVRGHLPGIFEQLLYALRKRQPLSRPGTKNTSTPLPFSFERRAGREPRRHFRLDTEAGYRDDAVPIKPQRLMHELARMFPPNTRYLADTGNSVAWAIHYLHPFDRRMLGKRGADAGLFRGSLEFASMGWAIGAAIGTALAGGAGPVVCITGDGSLLMNGQELSVAVQEHLPVIFVVLNDSALGMVKHGQRLAGAEPVGFELPEVDYRDFAVAMGAAGHVIRSPLDLQALDIDAMCKRPGPTLLDVRIDPDEVPPMQARIKVLEGAA